MFNILITNSYTIFLLIVSEVLFILSLQRTTRKFNLHNNIINGLTLLSILILVLFIISKFVKIYYPNVVIFNILYQLGSLSVFPKLILAPLLLLTNIFCLLRWLFIKLKNKFKNNEIDKKIETNISRRNFISIVGTGIVALPFIISIKHYFEKYLIKVRRHKLEFNNISEGLSGFKILHISDLHFGSYKQKEDFIELVHKVNKELRPDIILFTGDFINWNIEEINPYLEYLSLFFSRYGKYAVLGNHDHYNDVENKLIQILADCNIKVLNNECHIINTQYEPIQIVGLDYTGGTLTKWMDYGDAEQGFEKVNTKYLTLTMCHNPVIWDWYILNKQPAHITFAGHYHGGQIAVPFTDGKITPAKWFYKRLAGLYKENNQYLNVSRGINNSSYNIRYGFGPEITLIELQKIDNIV